MSDASRGLRRTWFTRRSARRPATARGARLVSRRLERSGFRGVAADVFRGAVRLTGEVDSWDEWVRVGYIGASVRSRGVVNDVTARGVTPPAMSVPAAVDDSIDGREYDVAVIGAGVIGCAIARELCRMDLRVAVLEKEDDVGVHASSRNDGMIHPGFAPPPGTRKAHYNSAGNFHYTRWAEELGFELRRVGSLVLFPTRLYWFLIPVMWARAMLNGVAGPIRFLSRAEVRRREPNVTLKQHGALFLPSTGVVNPFEVTIALAESAVRNGVEFHFETVVTGFDFSAEDRRITSVTTNRGRIRVAAVVNAAGGWSDKVAELADDRFFTIHGRRGVDVVLDKRMAGSQHYALSMPDMLRTTDSHTKGGGLIPSIHGNLIAGPSAQETPNRESYATTPEEFRSVVEHLALNQAVSERAIITYFAGVRSPTFSEDFIVERSGRVPNLVHAAGIQSPGFASAPAIAIDAAAMAVCALVATKGTERIRPNPAFNPQRVSRVDVSALSLAQRAVLIAARPDYGRLVCRCEDVTEGEVRDALRSPLGVCTLDAVKRRTRAGAGRCHGGFCMPRLLQIIRDETGTPIEQIRKKAGDSFLVAGRTKLADRGPVHA